MRKTKEEKDFFDILDRPLFRGDLMTVAYSNSSMVEVFIRYTGVSVQTYTIYQSDTIDEGNRPFKSYVNATRKHRFTKVNPNDISEETKLEYYKIKQYIEDNGI